MTMTETIADWLPSAVRDGPNGASDPERMLDALLSAVDEQVALLARDIDQVYDDTFIDSCADWAVPYIGSLLGLPSDATRLEVANTIALRRRKGTPAALEDFAEVVTGWTGQGDGGVAGDGVRSPARTSRRPASDGLLVRRRRPGSNRWTVRHQPAGRVRRTGDRPERCPGHGLAAHGPHPCRDRVRSDR